MIRIIISLFVMLLAVPTAAQHALTEGTIEGRVAALKPGEFLWAEAVAPEGPLLMVVSVPTSRAYMYRNGIPIGIAAINAGTPRAPAPPGVFTILEKQLEHRASEGTESRVPFMQRMTWSGVSLHGHDAGHCPVLDGCIRLPQAFARLLYDESAVGMTVIVTQVDSIPRIAPGPALLTPDEPQGALDHLELSWHPERAPKGPISIIVSAADREIHVLRNGVEIGAAPVVLGRDVTGLEVYTLAAANPEADSFRWLKVPLADDNDQPVQISADERAKLGLALPFRNLLAAELVVGTTVVVTPDSLAPRPVLSRGLIMRGTNGEGPPD
ncbi:L,D-transpeptidase family protein [Pacificimonas sp. WHA3]|uniref:L,D-transpeptidase family protein n=2 Tax=Pacificimonas pallii TaxID=2827236 RepID=A0ABS6SE14_9SPHN|nr:L,D-transpeptidase family protein [Pacificimonas pallii]